MKIIKIFIFLFISISSFAQSNQNIIGPSPNASSLGKFGDIPVSYATGIPNISIPLYEISTANLKIPVKLDYHAQGIKVEEIASWVGLGWALDCGGVITRSIRGLPDEAPAGYFNTAGVIPDPNVDRAAFYGWQPGNTYLRAVLNRVYDSEPDMYFYNFSGSAGKMVIDINKNVSTVPYKNYKITSGFNSLNQWTIVDEIGTTYIFGGTGAVETSNTELVCGSDSPPPMDQITAWYLKKVISSKGDEVNFEYETSSSSYVVNHSFTKYDLRQGPNPPGSDGRTCDQPMLDCQTLIGTNNIYLKRITWRNGSLEFTRSARQDFTDMYKLDKIDLKSVDGSILKSYLLQTSYFNGSEQRLKLYGVNFTDNAGKNEQYNLTYNETYNLPARFSNAQDYWGFFNGKTTNTSLIPAEINNCLDGADRFPDNNYTQANILTSISYPTGGNTQFLYELNSYGYNNLMPVASSDLSVTNSAVAAARWNANTNVSTTFTVLNSQCGTLRYSRSKRPGSTNPDPASGSYSFTRLSDGQDMLAYNGVPADGFSHPIQISPGQYQITASAEDLDNLTSIAVTWNEVNSTATKGKSAGGLRIKSIIDNDVANTIKTKNYTYQLSDEPDRSSGVLMSLPDFSYVGYQEKVAPQQSSGGSGSFNQTYECVFSIRQSAIVNALGSTQGSHISYSEVTVDNTQNGVSDGYSKFSFTSARDYPDSGPNVFPYPPKTSYDWRRGLLKSENDFTASNVLVKSVVNSYYFNNPSTNIFNYKTIPGIKVAYKKDNPVNDAMDEIVFEPYEVISEWFYQNSESTTLYDQNGANPVTTVTNYAYDNPLHAQLTKVIDINSDGKTKTKLSLYPQDYTSGTQFIDDMVTNHLIGLPIEQVKYQVDGSGTNILSGNINQYQPGGRALMDKVLKIENIAPIPLSGYKYSNVTAGQQPFGNVLTGYSPDTHYTERLTFNAYDALGNPLQITPKSSPTTTYLWGYNNTYPVAEIKNATYQQVLNVLGQATIDQLNNSPGADPTVQNLLSPLRAALPQAQVTTYTYLPLIGMTSMTDAKGMTTYYEYDSMQRLMNIKDKDGNVVKHLDYHYANQ